MLVPGVYYEYTSGFRQYWNNSIVGNKVKRQISKQVLQENKARQIFWKTDISYPYYAYVPVCTRA